MAALLNAGITPVVHEYGSLGCSGDLAPLSHCALVLMGEGRAYGADGDERRVRPDLLAAAGIEPVVLEAKEGLALINGTDGMLGMLCMAIVDLEQLCDVADVTAAMSVEALLGTDRVFLPELHEPLRPHPGQTRSAARMLAVAVRLADRGLAPRGRHHACRTPTRCAARRRSPAASATPSPTPGSWPTRELAAAVDNPVVLPDGRVESNGNFHGAPVAYVLDFLAIVAADLGSIAERRTDRLLDKARSHGLPPFLADDPGVDSGLMIAQYTQAALVSENKRLAVPGLGRLDPELGDAGGPRLDGLVGRAQAAPLRRQPAPHPRRRARRRRPAASTCARRCSPRRRPARCSHALRETVPGPGTDRYLAPELGAAEEFLLDGGVEHALAGAGVTLP